MTAPFESGYVGITPASHAPAPSRERPRRTVPRGSTLYVEGDEAEYLFRIDEGLVKLSLDLPNGKERIVTIAGPGDLIGALTPLPESYQESATALSHEVTFSATTRLELSLEEQAVAMAAAGLHLQHLRDALEADELPVGARLARALLKLGQRFGHITDEGVVHLTLPLTHDTLAAMIGAARETTTTLLGELRSKGLLEGTRGRYRFDAEAMRAFARQAAY
jgi:CRP/FNR family transcriptional regulator